MSLTGTTAAPTTTTTTTPAPAQPTTTSTTTAAPIAQAAETAQGRLMPPGPWTRAAAAEGLPAAGLRQLKAKVEPFRDSLVQWMRRDLPPTGVTEAEFHKAWDGTIPMDPAEGRVLMRALAEQVGGEYVPAGEKG